jgi:hypothetical protein
VQTESWEPFQKTQPVMENAVLDGPLEDSYGDRHVTQSESVTGRGTLYRKNSEPRGWRSLGTRPKDKSSQYGADSRSDSNHGALHGGRVLLCPACLLCSGQNHDKCGARACPDVDLSL